MDSALVDLFGTTCGYGLGPKSGIYCVKEKTLQNSPFGENYMLFTLGYLVIISILIIKIVLGFMIPLLMINLNDNMIIQFRTIFCY
jgi:hypothetical protein